MNLKNTNANISREKNLSTEVMKEEDLLIRKHFVNGIERRCSDCSRDGVKLGRRRSSVRSTTSNLSQSSNGIKANLCFLTSSTCQKEKKFQGFFQKFVVKSSNEKDLPTQEIVKRSTFTLMCSLTVMAGMIWGSMYYALGELNAAPIPFLYSCCNGTTLFFCKGPGMYTAFVRVQLFLIFALPCAVHLSLGGLQESGGVVLWSFLAPLGATFYRSSSESLWWLFIYILAIVALLRMELSKASTFSDAVTVGYWMMNIIGVSLITYAAAILFTRELELEYLRSESLLQNILPKPIAKRIKQGELPIVDNLDEVTILFADLVGFTKASSSTCPHFLIGEFLLDVFSTFDEIVENRGLEKIKTIGDAYMVVGGLHDKHKLNHTEEVMVLALEMLQQLENINSKYGLDFQIRIGVHTGPVIAGVLGVSKFTYGTFRRSKRRDSYLCNQYAKAL
jgi:adenylate cyclase